MERYKYIFCILVYRNVEDIKECIDSINDKVENCKIVIVNSFYDNESKNEFEKIAHKNRCDFINVENRGYGFGNNCGVDFIVKKYVYDYIIISNPDIIIKRFDNNINNIIANDNPCLIAPIITTKTGKLQNPYWLIKNSVCEWLIYIGNKYRISLISYTGIAINKLIREIGMKIFRYTKYRNMKIFAAHGCFFLISQKAVELLHPMYDEKMFMFAEEAYLAHKLEKHGIRTYLTKNIEIYHKEDGSIKFSSIKENDEIRKSIIYYYEALRGNQ